MKLIELIKEYSDKTIQTTIDRWKQDVPTLNDNTAKQIIQRFDQVKDGLRGKINQLSLSDELKQGNNFLNIDKYSFEDMVKLIRSIPEKEDKIKKDAIKLFIDREKIEKPTAQSYVNRFMSKKRDLKYAVENGTEDGNFTKAEVQKFIPRNILPNDAYLDPRVWGFRALEEMLDALFPVLGKVEDGDENTATTDGDKIYDKNNLEVFRGDSQHKCVSYNPTKDGRKQYGWCIAQPGNSNYDYYRFMQGNNRMFYFVFDRDLPTSNKYHAFVIHVGENNSKYWVTSAINDGDKQISKWNDISTLIPSSTWEKLKGLEPLFKYISPSKAEISAAALRGKKLSANDFKELDYDTKEEYIKANAGSLNKEILKVLDKELKNLAINYGQKFPYADLKDNEGLAKRYAIFRFRHTNYSKDPIPLPYVKYLDEPAKEKYLKTFNDNLTFEYIEKYFGPALTEKYVSEQLKNLDYLPNSAINYIKDPKLKTLFSIYSKLFEPWVLGSNTNIDEDKLDNMMDMPVQDIDPKPIDYKQWVSFSPNEKKTIIELAGKVNGNEKYLTLLYALPYIIKKDGKLLVLLPEDKKNNDRIYPKWVLVDGDNVVMKLSGDEYSIDNQSLSLGYHNISGDPRRIFDFKELKNEKLRESRDYGKLLTKMAIRKDPDALTSLGKNWLPKNEIKVNNPNIQIPREWTEDKNDEGTEWDEGETIIKHWEAPMEGWDDNHFDHVYIIKKDNGFYVKVSFSFGDILDYGPFNLNDAYQKVTSEMKEIMDDWEDVEDEEDDNDYIDEVTKRKNKSIKEKSKLYEDWNKFSLMRRAGILK